VSHSYISLITVHHILKHHKVVHFQENINRHIHYSKPSHKIVQAHIKHLYHIQLTKISIILKRLLLTPISRHARSIRAVTIPNKREWLTTLCKCSVFRSMLQLRSLILWFVEWRTSAMFIICYHVRILNSPEQRK